MFLVTSLPLFWASSSSEHISFHWPLCYLFLHLLDHSLPESPLPARCILDHRQHWPIPPSASFCWSSQSTLRDYAQEGSVPLQVQGALRRALGTWQFLLFFSRRLFRELSDFSSFHPGFTRCWGPNSGLCACEVSTLSYRPRLTCLLCIL